MKRSDIPDEHVIELARRWHRDPSSPGVVYALVSEGIPEKLALSKVEHMENRGLLEYGTTPYYAWPAEPDPEDDPAARLAITCGMLAAVQAAFGVNDSARGPRSDRPESSVHRHTDGR